MAPGVTAQSWGPTWRKASPTLPEVQEWAAGYSGWLGMGSTAISRAASPTLAVLDAKRPKLRVMAGGGGSVWNRATSTCSAVRTALAEAGQCKGLDRRVQRFAVSVVAAFIMVMWDLSMDPSRATMSQAWIWHDGGSYFGVPFVNFMGWYLTVHLIFQILALVLQKQQSRLDPATNGDNRRDSWHLNTAFYFATFVEFPAMAWLAVDRPLTDAANVTWSSRAMFESLGLVAIFTMGFVCFLAFFSVRQAGQLG